CSHVTPSCPSIISETRMRGIFYEDAAKRAAGIEPASTAWKADALPLSYARAGHRLAAVHPYAWPTESDAFALVPALSLAYYLVVRRRRVEPFRVASFVLAMLLLVAVFATPLETLALNRLLTAHFLQNVAVPEWVPAF